MKQTENQSTTQSTKEKGEPKRVHKQERENSKETEHERGTRKINKRATCKFLLNYLEEEEILMK